MWDFRFGQVALLVAASGGVKKSETQPYTLGDIFPSLRSTHGVRSVERANNRSIQAGIQDWVAMCWNKATGGRGK